MQENVIYFEEDSVDEIEVDGVIVWSDEDKIKASFENVPLDRIYVGDNIVYGEDVVQPPIPPTVPPDNEYLEIVNIPEYDISNPEHLLINESNGNWAESNLNNAAYKHFYIEPGDYSDNTITITSSGTSEDRRSISLYSENDTHPASLPEDQQANTRVIFDDAHYWDIDRLSELDKTDTSDVSFMTGESTHNVINRWHVYNYYSSKAIGKNCSYNTIQNSFIDYQTHEGRLSDNAAILVSGGSCESSDVNTFGTKIINNDIRNSGDAVQFSKEESCDLTQANYNGTVVDSNRIWNDGSVYTNGDYSTNGYDADGEYQICENAIDLKAGSDDPDDPMIITNNIMWGYKQGDKTAGGSWTPGAGKAVTIHFGIDNLIFDNNIIFDSQTIIGTTSPQSAPYAMLNSTFKNNIFYDSGSNNPNNDDIYSMFFYYCSTLEIENNSFIDFDVSTGSVNGFRFENSGDGNTFKNNVGINFNNTSSDNGAEVADNYYYDCANINLGGTGNTDYNTTEESSMGDYIFEYERYTSEPKSKTLVGVITTEASPHNGVAGSDIKQK